MIYLFDRAKKLQKIIPRKHIINATQTKVRNGIYQLAVEVPLFYETKQGTQYNYQKSVSKATFAGHYDDKNRFQLYKIYSRNVTANEQGEFLLFDGVHIFFDEAKAMGNIHDRRFRDSEAKAPADVAFNSIGWTIIDYDFTDRHDINFYRASVTDAWNDLISTYGVEFDYELQFDGRKIISKNIIMKKQIGRWIGQRFAYGTNVLTLTQEQDESEVYTAAVGRGRGEEAGDGFGPRLEFGDIAWSKEGITKPVGQNWIEIPSATAEFGFVENRVVKPRIAPEVIFEDIEDKKKLADATYYWLLENCLPKATWKTEVARIGNLKLGDTVGVLYKAAGIIKRARVEKIEYNLLDPELSKLTLGDFHHFENRQMKRINAEIKRLGRDNRSLISQAKDEFNQWFNDWVTAFENQFAQAKIDIFAEIEADRENMQNLLDTKSAEWTENFNQSVAESKEYAEQQAQEKASAVQSNLDSFKDSHRQLYDEVTGNILDIDTFLGDKSKTLKQQFDKVRTDFGTLQTDLDGVESDLNTTKSDLQKQLDSARADLDGLEIGGRNLIPNSNNFTNWSTSYSGSVGTLEYNFEIPEWGAKNATKVTSTGGDHQIRFYHSIQGTNGETVTWSIWVKNVGNNPFLVGIDGKYVEIPVGFSDRVTITKNTRKNYTWVQSMVRVSNEYIGEEIAFVLWKEQAEFGNIATDWTPAPEDTEQKITTLNQQIEFIDGQLSAKLEQTDLLPINNKITEYGNTLTANAQSIESLISKTELHDGDITKWSNQTTANAESITSALSRISNTESGLTKAQTDIIANADGLSAVVNRVNKTETGIESLTTDFNIEAGKVETLITKTDGHASQLTNIVADYEKIEQTVAKNDDWLGTHGSNLLQTVEGFEQKVWMSDIQNIGANLIPFSDTQNQAIMVENWEFLSDGGSTFYTGVTSSNFFTLRNTRSGTNLRMKSRLFDRLVAGKEYTLSFLIQRTSGVNSNYNYTWINRPSGVGNLHLGSPTRITNNNDGTYTHEYVFTSDYTGKVGVSIGSYTSSGQDLWLRIKEPKLERGTKRTPYMTAFSVVEQRAEELSLRVQELSSINGEELITQSDISILPDRVLIGSQNIGAIDMASILSVSPSAIDMITDKLNLTGNLNVKGQIESLAVSAVRGDIAYLKTNILTANSITSEHLSVSTAMVHKLFAASARIDELITKSHFVNNVKAMSIEAVEGQFSSLMTKYFSANYIDVDYINGKNAWFESQYTLNANIAKLTAQHAFIRDVQAIEITANQLNIQTLHSKLKSVEGGLTIYGPDGRVLINNSMLRASFDVQVYDAYGGNNVEFAGLNYYTSSSFWQTFKYFYTDFKGSQLLVSWAVGLQSGNSASEYAEVQVRGFGGNNPIGSRSSRQFVKPGETTYHNQIINLGVPDYSTIQGYLEFRRSPTGVSMNNTVYARVLRVSLIN